MMIKKCRIELLNIKIDDGRAKYLPAGRQGNSIAE